MFLRDRSWGVDVVQSLIRWMSHRFIMLSTVHSPLSKQNWTKMKVNYDLQGFWWWDRNFCLVLSTFSANQDWFSMITVQVRNRGHTGQLVEIYLLHFSCIWRPRGDQPVFPEGSNCWSSMWCCGCNCHLRYCLPCHSLSQQTLAKWRSARGHLNCKHQ